MTALVPSVLIPRSLFSLILSGDRIDFSSRASQLRPRRQTKKTTLHAFDLTIAPTAPKHVTVVFENNTATCLVLLSKEACLHAGAD